VEVSEVHEKDKWNRISVMYSQMEQNISYVFSLFYSIYYTADTINLFQICTIDLNV